MPADPRPLFELELGFRSTRTGEATRLIFGGLELKNLPATSPEQYQRGWQAPIGIGNPPRGRSMVFHLNAQDRWLDHHAIGIDGPLLHWDAANLRTIHLYLLSYERHALPNHIVLVIPPDAP